MEVQFATLWEKTSDLIPDEPALICGDVTRSWKEYEERASRLATLLTEHGLGDDSKVGLYLHNSNEYLEAFQKKLTYLIMLESLLGMLAYKQEFLLH